MSKNLIIILAVVLLVGVGGLLVFSRSSKEGGVSQKDQTNQVIDSAEISGNFVKGQAAPEVTFTDFEGSSHNLSDFRDKAVVLDFWAAWCPFCIEEMPLLQSAHEKYQDELVMIGVHRTDTEKTDTGLKFALERGVSYLLVADPDGSLYAASGGFGMPVAVFIDKEGIVQDIKVGPKTKEEIEEKISELI